MANTTVPAELVSNSVYERKNLIINGAMQVAQRATSVTASSSAVAIHTVDRFITETSGGTYDVQQSTDHPNGYKYSQMVTMSGAFTPSADQYLIPFEQRIEGDSLQRLAYGTSDAKKLTLSFWIKSTKTGTYVVELSNNNSGQMRKYSQSYTISSANTWEHKTLTYAGDTSTAFEDGTAADLTLFWWMTAGTTYTSGTLATAWENNTSANRAVGVPSSVADDDSWQLTGVQLEASDEATPFEHLTFDEDFTLCKRYYQKYSGFHAMAMWTYGRSNGSMQFVLEKEMRTKPTFSYSGTLGSLQTNSHCGIYESDWVTISSLSAGTSSEASNSRMMRIDSAHPSNTFASANVAVGFYAGSNFFFIFDSEI